MAFSFITLISPSDTSTKHEAAILNISPHAIITSAEAIITSAEVIIAEYDVIFGQWEREDFYNHLSNYTNQQLFTDVEMNNSPHCNRPSESGLEAEWFERPR